VYLQIEETANESLVFFDEFLVVNCDRFCNFLEDVIGFLWKWCRQRVALFHAPFLEQFIDVEVLVS